jgi:hypothetical protein
MKTEASRLFDELNARHWRGRLPRYRVIRLPTSAMKNKIAYCRNLTLTIAVRRELTGEELRLAMLHEMCHIDRITTRSGWQHGPVFRRRVRRLVERGESKLIEDLERYDGTAAMRRYEQAVAAGDSSISVDDRPLRVRVSERFESLIFGGGSRRRWSTVARWLANEYGLSTAQLRRTMPWAEADWRRMTAEWRELEKAHAAWPAAEAVHELA